MKTLMWNRTQLDTMNAIDLFAGAGGMSYGLESSGIDVIWALDNEENTKDTFDENHSAELYVGDITELDPESVGPPKSDVSIVVGGPPCPTFSSVGRSKINSLDGQTPQTDERHQLYQDFLRFVNYYEPDVFVMENVKGMTSATNKSDEIVRDVIKSEMEHLGYTVTANVIDAANFGVPQHRERLFFIGNSMNKSNPNLSNWESHRPPQSQTESQLTFKSTDTTSTSVEFSYQPDSKEPWNTVADAILDLPPVVSDGNTPPKSTDSYIVSPVSEYQRKMRQNTEENELYNHTCRGHNMRDLTLYKLLGEGVTYQIGDLPEEHQPYRTDIFPDKIKKQNPSEPSSTVVAHLAKDGHMFVHPTEARSITVREAARLQSFPDDFVFPVARTHAYKQVGNAVPPRLAQAIGTAISSTVL